MNVAVGVRVKSGWAATVVLGGPPGSPQVLDSFTLNLSDAAVPATRQPYHAGMGVAQTNAARLGRLIKRVERCARRSVAQLVRTCRANGRRIRGVGIVVGSDIDPQRIANPHIRAHASEGRLFRTVIERAAKRHALRTVTTVERDMMPLAAIALGQSEGALRRAVTELGGPASGPWRAEQKMAALAAWMILEGKRR
ncbi:MAG: hypothetical protein DMD29_07455 [Gemmatimonadetes bacterium]|nr:MAG: hypothetical protein DMD29_07455 [Gemmatimonadota bacterium]